MLQMTMTDGPARRASMRVGTLAVLISRDNLSVEIEAWDADMLRPW